MKRSVALALVALLSASLVGTEAVAAGKKKGKKRVERLETRQYVGFSGFRGAVEGTCDAEPVACVIFPVEEGERFVSVEVSDTAGMPVWASVYIDGYPHAHEHVCGTSDAPLEMVDGLETLVVTITQTTGGATNPCVGPATAGTVTATFSNVP